MGRSSSKVHKEGRLKAMKNENAFAIRINKHRLLHYILIYCVIMMQGSIIFKTYQDFFYIGALLLFGVIYLPKRYLPNKQYFIRVALLFCSLLITLVITGGSLSFPSILNIISRFLIVYIVVDFDKTEFCTRYVKVVYFLSIVSLFFYGLQLTAPDIIKMVFPRYTIESQVFYGAFLYTMGSSTLIRNCGIFMEPGIYQIVLLSAIYIILFMNKEVHIASRKKTLSLIVLICTLVTGQSTTGYVSLALVVAVYMFSKVDRDTRIYKKMIIPVLCVFFVWDLYQGENGLIYTTIIKKMFNTSGNVDLTVSTGASRYYSALADIKVFLKYPLGAGFDIYGKEWRSSLIVNIGDIASTAGLTRSFATLGIINSLLILSMYLWLMKKNGFDIYMKVAYILMFVNISMAQPSIYFPALMIILFIDAGKNY